MKIMTEWKVFAAYAVDYLGMPVEAMPLYSTEMRWKKKANIISDVILQSGTFGHADCSYIQKDSILIRKLKSLRKGTKEHFRLISIFPIDALAF